ncbi:hypothetical protein RHOSPDRAFT_33250 [Rhodotorula sp. JG-1b]|nr:hypothetical protein RHOSPDRAFT_33250 [Rhodotorula sp. JG-1b]
MPRFVLLEPPSHDISALVAVISALCTLIVANPSRRSSCSSLRLTLDGADLEHDRDNDGPDPGIERSRDDRGHATVTITRLSRATDKGW